MNNDQLITETLLKTIHDDIYIKMLGIEIITISTGYAKSRMKVTREICNPYNSVHGGCLFSLADITAGYASCSYGNYVSTVSGNMNYIKPAMNTQYIYCVGQVVRQGKQISVYNVELSDNDGNILETGSFTFFTLNKKVINSSDNIIE
ncbi:PaaI family thioesterase [uncultured Clostridium sp.]|uniref:PaaI family thioesterase n=1 Tax=uncultured Clostridium sp. TaxID=59620 RepID=UPI0025DE915A|nr:PaaI family thioesterase [uncultured Clostridium sp.]